MVVKSGPMLPYCQLDPNEHISMNFCLKSKCFLSLGQFISTLIIKCFEAVAICNKAFSLEAATIASRNVSIEI